MEVKKRKESSKSSTDFLEENDYDRAKYSINKSKVKSTKLKILSFFFIKPWTNTVCVYHELKVIFIILFLLSILLFKFHYNMGKNN